MELMVLYPLLIRLWLAATIRVLKEQGMPDALSRTDTNRHYMPHGFVEIESVALCEGDKFLDLPVRFLHCSGDAHINRSAPLFIDLIEIHDCDF